MTPISHMMASADPVAGLTCYLCMNIYTDPVSLRCGHSFCRLCVDYVQDYHLVYGKYLCPVCRKSIKDRPLLQSNTQILHKIQSYQDVQGGEETTEEVAVYCLYCVESQVPAVKTCVQCETPLCDRHLEAHNKELNHVLIPPTARKCSEHNHLLQYYCSQDGACICESCSLTGNHRDHDIIPMKDAFESEKNKLHNFLCELKRREEKIDRSMQSMVEVRSKVRERTEALKKTMNSFLTHLRKQINLLQNKVKDFLYEEMQKLLRAELNRRLHKQKETLSRKISRVGELCNIRDPVTLLQKVELDKDLYNDVPDEETEQNDELGCSVEDLNVDITGSLLDGLSELNEEFLKLYG